MIYVNAGFAYEERIGIIRNVELDTGTEYRIHTGMYLDSSSQISYKNIKIVNTTRGIYIANKNDKGNHTNEVFMDEIHISKSLVENSNPFDISTTIGTVHQSKEVGIDCHAADCHFSNIVVEDYLVGMKLIGGDNRVKNALCHNSHSPQQQGCSVGYINGGTNYYIDCTSTDCFAGWMSYYAVPFFLNNCTWDVSNTTITNNPYRFYISPAYYSGGAIYATNSHIVNPSGIQYVLCNVQNNDINLNPPEDNSNNEN